MARRVLSEEDATEINLSPMIDCIFILLIFFIVTTVFVEEKGLQVYKPDAAATPSLEEKETLTLEITAHNKVLIDSREIGVGDVAAQVKAKGVASDTPVTIRAHSKSDHSTFVRVWDAAKRAGAETLSFNTVD